MSPAPDYEAEYNNRARVPEHPAIMASWARDAAAWREASPPRVLHYGGGERHTIDWFVGGAGPAMLFVHGGYWQALDKTSFSHMARGLSGHGVSVGVMSYDLCPAVRIGDIVEQVRAAVAVANNEARAPVIVSGHSAGGHLAACMLATEAHVPAAYSISGLFDLAPLIQTNLNLALKLNTEEAANLSPLFWPSPGGKVLDAVVGADESAEFRRQSHAIVEAWGADGAEARYEELAGANHFTILAPLADPASAMCARLKALADRAARR